MTTQITSPLDARFDVEDPLRALFGATSLDAFAERVEKIVRVVGAEREKSEP